MNRNTGEIRHMAKEEMDDLNKSFFETETSTQGGSPEADEEPLWFDVGAMLHQGRIIRIDDVMWEIKRASTKQGMSGRVTLKLKYRGHV